MGIGLRSRRRCRATRFGATISHHYDEAGRSARPQGRSGESSQGGQCRAPAPKKACAPTASCAASLKPLAARARNLTPSSWRSSFKTPLELRRGTLPQPPARRSAPAAPLLSRYANALRLPIGAKLLRFCAIHSFRRKASARHAPFNRLPGFSPHPGECRNEPSYGRTPLMWSNPFNEVNLRQRRMANLP